MPESAWTKMTRSPTRDELKLMCIVLVLFISTAWLYFRAAHHVPVVVDMLFPLWYFPALHLVILAVERKLGLNIRRWTDDADGQPERHWRDSAFNRNGLFASLFVICLGWWIAIDHTGRFPVDWAVVLFVLGVLGIFLVPCVNAAVHVIRSKVAP